MKKLILENCVTESVIDSIHDTVESWLAAAERKLSGYSTTEIDVLAKAAKSVDSETKKRATLERIENALKDARIELNETNKADKKRELRLQIQVLGELKAKVSSFKVVEVKEVERKHKNSINLDER